MSTRRDALVTALERQSRIEVLATVMNMQVIATQAGINMTDVQCLNLLTLEGPLTPSQIAQAMAMSKGGAITAMIDRLEKGGYLRRTRDPHDRRKVLVEVETDGEPLRRLADLFTPIGAGFTSVAADYTDDQLEVVVDYLTRNNETFIRQLAALA